MYIAGGVVLVTLLSWGLGSFVANRIMNRGGQTRHCPAWLKGKHCEDQSRADRIGNRAGARKDRY